MVRPWLSLFLLMTCNRICWASSIKSNSTKKQTYLSKLCADYDKDVRPFLGERTVKVDVDIHIDSIGIIEEAKMEIPIYFYLRQYWTDPRLAGKINHSITFSGGVITNFWRPDLYCYNARHSNMMVEDKDVNSQLIIYPNGSLTYSRGSTVVASCEMDLRKFPMDTQNCKLIFGSYSQTDVDLIFSWKDNEIVVENKELSQFALVGITVGREKRIYNKENFTNIFFTIKLARRSGYYIIQAYCPDMLIVALSWIILWMDVGAIGDRLSLGITTILTVMFLLGSINAFLPKVSYAKAIDWYLIVSFIFVFLTLVESMIVFLIMAKDTDDKKNQKSLTRKFLMPIERMSMRLTKRKNRSSDVTNDADIVLSDANNDLLEQPVQSIPEDDTVNFNARALERTKKSKHAKKQVLIKCAKIVDKSSRFLFPLSFLVFNIFYWIYYTMRP